MLESLYVVDTKNAFVEIVEQGTELPYEKSFEFATAVDNQTSITIDLATGVPKSYCPLVRILVDNLPPQQSAGFKVTVTMRLTQLSKISFKIRNSLTQEELGFKIQKYSRTVDSIVQGL